MSKDAPGHTDLMVCPETIDKFLEENPLPVSEKIAGDLSATDRARIDAAWERHKRAGQPDWPPRMSAVGLRDGSLARGSTGQTWEVQNGQWVRLFI